MPRSQPLRHLDTYQISYEWSSTVLVALEGRCGSGRAAFVGRCGVAAVTAALLQAAPSSASHDGDPSVFDCAGDPPGKLQSINGSTTAGNYTMFKRLDITTGDYVSAGTSNLVWGDLILRGNGRQMNATATDPATGKSFGRLSADGAGPVLVQFDMDGHARLLSSPGSSSWAAVVTSGVTMSSRDGRPGTRCR